MLFHAIPGGVRASESSESPRHDMSGRWAVRFHETDGDDTASIGEFAQRGSRLFGTFLNPNGDHRFLAGYVRGNDFKLSTFDGAHAFVFSGSINETGDIENADFWAGTSWHQTWSAVRDEDVRLPDAFARTYLQPGYDRFEFEFPRPDGTMVSQGDARFAGKVVLVTLSGSWCPNCNDATEHLVELHKRYRERGLSIVGLAFEMTGDFERDAEQVRTYRDYHGIDFPLLIAGTADKEEASAAFPLIDRIKSFPTTIFLHGDGRVHTVYSGYSGPATGEAHEKLKRHFEDIVEELLGAGD